MCKYSSKKHICLHIWTICKWPSNPWLPIIFAPRCKCCANVAFTIIGTGSKSSAISVLPWVPEVFLRCGGNFWCWPKADTSLAVVWSREKTLWHGAVLFTVPVDLCTFYQITFTPNRLKVSDCDHVGRHVKKCPNTHIILSKTSSSLKFIA